MASITPQLNHQSDDEPLLCPICQHEVIPADASESDDPDAIKPCAHVVLQHLWGYDPDLTDPAIQKWWDSVTAEREQLEEKGESQETIYRQCPHIEYLIEHMSAGPMLEFVASFGFRENRSEMNYERT